MGKEVTAEKQYIADKFGLPFGSLSASYLRMETLLGTSANVLFNINNQNNLIASENRLLQSDQFIVTHLGFAIKKIASDTPTAAQHAAAKLYTYLNTNTGLFDGTNDANIQAIYNGFFQISLNRKTYVPAIDMRSFERVPDTQEGTLVFTASNIKRDSYPNGLFGYFPTDYIRLNGYDNLQPEITLPASVAMDESSESNYAVLLMKGYLASGQGVQSAVGAQ